MNADTSAASMDPTSNSSMDPASMDPASSMDPAPKASGSSPARVRRHRSGVIGFLDLTCPYLFGIFVLIAWEGYVRFEEVPTYLVPGPILITRTLFENLNVLAPSLWITLRITLEALVAAAVGGMLLALLFASSRWVERTLFPYAVILQVTPVVAIAPLIIIWVSDTWIALLICAWLVAFFPVVSNTTVGLNSTDRNLLDLFKLYGASRWQTLLWLKLPGALPYYLAGVRISGGLALIGAVVAEFVAGAGGTQSGLAYRILESGYRLQIPLMFAALLLISVTGIVIFILLDLLSRFILRRWHESALPDSGRA